MNAWVAFVSSIDCFVMSSETPPPSSLITLPEIPKRRVVLLVREKVTVILVVAANASPGAPVICVSVPPVATRVPLVVAMA